MKYIIRTNNNKQPYNFWLDIHHATDGDFQNGVWFNIHKAMDAKRHYEDLFEVELNVYALDDIEPEVLCAYERIKSGWKFIHEDHREFYLNKWNEVSRRRNQFKVFDCKYSAWDHFNNVFSVDHKIDKTTKDKWGLYQCYYIQYYGAKTKHMYTIDRDYNVAFAHSVYVYED